MSIDVSRRDKVLAWPPMGKNFGEHLRGELIDKAEGIYQGLEVGRRGHHSLLHPYDLQRDLNSAHPEKRSRRGPH